MIPGIQILGSYLTINASGGCSDLSLVSVRWCETPAGGLVSIPVSLTLRLTWLRLPCRGKLCLVTGRWRDVGKLPPQANLDVAGRASIGVSQVKKTWGRERESEREEDSLKTERKTEK